MSRIGKKPVAVPAGVTVTLEGQALTVKGPKGQLSWTVVDDVEIKYENNELTLTPRNDEKRARAMWGLSRSLVFNLVHGVTQGYEAVLELVGVGYRAALKGQSLSMQLGYSHDVEVPPPAGISFAVPKPSIFHCRGRAAWPSHAFAMRCMARPPMREAWWSVPAPVICPPPT